MMKTFGDQKTQKNNVREAFSEDAEDYLNSYVSPKGGRSFPFRRRREIVLGMFQVKTGKVLDIGSGPGVYTGELLDRNNEVWTVDISEKMIELAKKVMENHPKFHVAHFQVGDIENLEFEEDFFDAVLCVGVLEYLNQVEPALNEIARVLKHGGEVIITGPNRKSPTYKTNLFFARLFNLIFGFIIKRIKGKLFFQYNFQHQVFDPDHLDKIIENAGFQINQRRYNNYKIAILKGPFEKLNDRFTVWAERNLVGTHWEKFGSNYNVRAIKGKA